MLVLSRKVGESIVIGGVVVTVLALSGGKLRLGVKAPPEVSILRSELLAGSAPPDGKTHPRRQPPDVVADQPTCTAPVHRSAVE
jgi:carbon storage regulator